jgi:hypothetical protein
VLLAYGADLETMMKAEIVLHWDLQANGHAFFLESDARVYHMNFERLSSFLQVQFHAGRVFASVRARSWPALRRVLYIIGSPLIPAVRLRWVLGQLRARGRQEMPSGVLPAVVVGLLVSAVGELSGYSLGAGDASHKLSHFEFHRTRHVKKKTREAASTGRPSEAASRRA